jgi:hypothetical protein
MINGDNGRDNSAQVPTRGEQNSERQVLNATAIFDR